MPILQKEGKREKLEQQWQALNPVFVRGMQRSGTSMMGRILHQLGILGFGEGHLWDEIARPFERLLDPTYQPDARADAYALGEDRAEAFQKYIALAVDQFHRDHLPSHMKRWMDKSPGAKALHTLPLLMKMFPKAQVIFMHRNGIACVESGIRFWKENPDIFTIMCQGWAETMSTWRKIRDEFKGRYIEIAQEEMAVNPVQVATQITAFLGTSEDYLPVASLMLSKRVLSSFPDKKPGDYTYRIQWTEEQKAFFIETCGEEMEAWGYPIDFEHVGPRIDEGSVRALHTRILNLEAQCRILQEQLESIQNGRIMRMFTYYHRLKKRLKHPFS